MNKLFQFFRTNKDEKKITEFKSGKWYRWIGPKKRPSGWNHLGEMDFLLDGKPHQCNKGARTFASFFDSPDSDYQWAFYGDMKYFREVKAL